MKIKLLITAFLVLLAGVVTAQPTATDLSYYPLHVGNVWLYRAYVITPNGEVFNRHVEYRVVKDSLHANGRRYFEFNTSTRLRDDSITSILHNSPVLRIDSATGMVYRSHGAVFQSNCAVTSEHQVLDLSVSANSQYMLCGGWSGDLPWSVSSLPSGTVGELYYDVQRPRRQWLQSFTGDEYRYAEGIGPYYFRGPSFVDKVYYLVHAHINGVDYWPVTFRSFTASPLPDNQVHLRWRTEAEVQNAGFTVQRLHESANDRWEDLRFIPARAAEHAGADYEYTDVTPASLPAGTRLQYRLRQIDYDGSTAYSDVVTVELASHPNRATLTAWPNPAVDHVSIHVGGSGDTHTDVLVTDLLGRELRRFESVPAGGVLTWYLTAADGSRVPTGLYRLLLVGEDGTVGRMLMVR
jgi:hypothetical protein